MAHRRLLMLMTVTFAQYCLIGATNDVTPVIHFDRKIQSFVNPGIDANSTNGTLMYIEAVGDKDVIHSVWDFTFGTPTMLFAVTDLNVSLDVIWSWNKPSAFKFSETPKYSFGLQINKIWEFNDANDTAKFNPDEQQYVEFNCHDIEWERLSVIQEEGDATLVVIARSIGKGEFKRVGDVTVKFDLFPFSAHALDLPHLIHSANSSLVDIALGNMTLSDKFNKSRFAIELVMISAEKIDGEFKVNIRKGLDDEHTPGVFEIIEVISPETLKNGDGGFVQFRPVTYTTPVRGVEFSNGIHMGELGNATVEINSVANMFFSDVAENFNVIARNMCITFGTQQDGFYKKTNYVVWSLTVGYGNPPIDNFSLFLIILLCIGLGVPALFCALGGICIYFKKDRAENEPRRLIEE